MTIPKNILIFEPDSSGHHPGYLFHLINNFLLGDYDYHLIVLVTPEFFKKHPQIIQKTTSPKVRWIQFTDSEFKAWKKPKNIFKRSVFEWELFCAYALKYEVSQGLLMYLDYLQFSILTQSPPPCPISGILFRPTLVNYPSENLKEKIDYWRKEKFLKLVLNKKVVKNIFNLDSFATEYVKNKWSTSKMIFLPDPVQVYPSQNTLLTFKASLGIKENRKVFLVFGSLDSRKGISEIMDAIAKISKELSQKGCLLIVGPWEESEKIGFEQKLKNTSQLTDFQIITVEKFIEEENIQQYFEIADYVLALYQKHIGMSAIMVRAAASQKPVLAYNYGLMGKIIKENELGLIIKNDLAEKLEMILESNTSFGNTEKMQAFAKLNQAENYAKVILENLQT
jgi:glycosyltransferase involved in cell wall biosynthesis